MDTREQGNPRGIGYRNGRAAMWMSLVVIVGGFVGFQVWENLYEPAGEAPDFTIMSTGYENGVRGEPVEFSLSDYEGRVVVLDLMAVNCAACETVANRVLKPIHQSYNESDVVIVSVDTWADPETNQLFAGAENRTNLIKLQRERELVWRHGLDTDKVWLKYSAIALPKVAVIDADGMIVKEFLAVPSLAAVEDAIAEAQTAGERDERVLRLPILGMAAIAGIAAFFAPCSVGLVPAYMSLLLRTDKQLHGAQLVGATLRGGLVTAAGIVAMYSVFAVGLFAAGPWLAQHLGRISVVTGVALVLIGLLMFRTGLWDGLASKVGMGKIDGRRGYFAFGVGFGLASFGCTGPAFLPILLGAFARSDAYGFLAFALYAGSLSLLMLLAAGLVASGQQTRLRSILDKSALITRISASLFVVAGAYVLWFHYQATGSWW